jgi:predicted acylesterase/phospholipase RssA
MSDVWGSQVETGSPSPSSDVPIALALSGGGFRATLFHLGVIRFLKEYHLLGRVQYVCSVSGGSILAAHLVLNWAAYLGEFDKVADQLLDFIRSDVRGRVVRRWLLSWTALPLRLLPRFRHSRVALLEEEYAGLLGGKKLADLSRQGEAPVTPPKLSILAASMTTGRLCAFDSDGFRILENPKRDPDRQSDSEKDKPVSIDTGNIPVALAVTASSAFPVLFPPVPIDHHRLSCPQKDFNTTEYLTDGGVFENLGLWMLRKQHEASELPAGAVLVSDAQLPFDWAGKARFGLIFARANRTTDVLMKRITEFEYETAQTEFGDKLVYQRCKCDRMIKREKDRNALPPDIQRTVAMIRTDLNRFSEEEIDALLRHGYTHARLACIRARLVPASVDNPPWSPVKPNQKVELGGLVGSERQPKGFFAWDRYTLGYVPLLLLWLTGVAVGLHWLTYLPVLAYKAMIPPHVERPIEPPSPVEPSFRDQLVVNMSSIRGDSLTPTVRQAKELLQRMAAAPDGAGQQNPAYLQLKAKMGERGRPTTSAKCRLVYPRADDFPVVGHWVFRVRPGPKNNALYEALDVKQITDPKVAPSVSEFLVPPADPDDYLLVLSAIQVPQGRFLPQNLGTLIHVEGQ